MSPGLVQISGVAKILGIPVRSAARIANGKDFPKPEATLGAGRVWREADVKQWKRTTTVPLGRGRGRPPKQA